MASGDEPVLVPKRAEEQTAGHDGADSTDVNFIQSHRRHSGRWVCLLGCAHAGFRAIKGVIAVGPGSEKDWEAGGTDPEGRGFGRLAGRRGE
jgi:hypothetical protein